MCVFGKREDSVCVIEVRKLVEELDVDVVGGSGVLRGIFGRDSDTREPARRFFELKGGLFVVVLDGVYNLVDF